MKALTGIRVMDFTNVLAGPYCSMMLANMGAEVLKVEKPYLGDDSRHYGPHVNGESAYFLSINRGKKSVTCDTKTEEGKAFFRRMVEKTDILVENLKPGAMERMGLGYDALKEINPRLIYVAVSGFGHTGPYSPRPAYDMIVQAMGGVMSITGTPGGDPVRVGTSIGDIVAGMFGAFGAVNALYMRERTGLGQKVDVAMLDSQLAILENAITKYAATGIVAKPMGLKHPSITPFEAYRTKDSWIIAAAGNNNLFAKLCQVTGNEALISDPRFDTNPHRNQHIDELSDYIQAKMYAHTTEEWMKIMTDAGIPCGPINTIDKLFSDPQVEARHMLVEVEQPGIGKLKVAGNPVKMSLTPPQEELSADPAPELGANTREVMLSLGYSESEVEDYLNKFQNKDKAVKD